MIDFFVKSSMQQSSGDIVLDTIIVILRCW